MEPEDGSLFALIDEIRDCTSCACLLAERAEDATFEELVHLLISTVKRHREFHSTSLII